MGDPLGFGGGVTTGGSNGSSPPIRYAFRGRTRYLPAASSSSRFSSRNPIVDPRHANCKNRVPRQTLAHFRSVRYQVCEVATALAEREMVCTAVSSSRLES